MSLLIEIRNLLSRKKHPVIVDISTEQVQEPSKDGLTAEPQVITDDDPSSATASGSSVPDATTAKPTKSWAALGTKRSAEEVVVLLRDIAERIGSQTDQVRHIAELGEQIPRGLESLGNLNRHSVQLLELSTDQAENTKSQFSNLNTTLSQIRSSGEHHTEVLGLIQQHADTNARTAREFIEGMENLNRNLVEISEGVRTAIDSISALDRSGEDAQTKLGDFISKTHNWTIIAISASALASILAIAVAIIALFRNTGG
ncbi:MAG: hypothetical protein IH984_09655 [Planctomycetes bacterium]|nr:hypothetical protein [Planctomycetota bacterium]